jgi:hypothetical protein
MRFLLTLLSLITEYIHFLVGAAILIFAAREGFHLLQEHAQEVDNRVLLFALMLATAFFLPIAVEIKKRLWLPKLSDDPYPVVHLDFEKPYTMILPTGLAEATEAYKLVHRLFRHYHFPENVELENFRRNKFSMAVVLEQNGEVAGAVDLFCLKDDALEDLLHGRITEPEVTINELDFPATQTSFYISAFSARPITYLAEDQGEYLLKEQRHWIAKSLVYGMAKMIERCYLQSDLACGRKLDRITLYALAYRRTGERWLKLAGFDLMIPSADKDVKYRIANILRPVLSLFGIKSFSKFVGARYPVYKLVVDGKIVRKFLKGHASFSEGVTMRFTNIK